MALSTIITEAVDSQPGPGALFTISLPRKQTPTPALTL